MEMDVQPYVVRSKQSHPSDPERQKTEMDGLGREYGRAIPFRLPSHRSQCNILVR